MKKSKSKFGRDLRILRHSTIRRSGRSVRSGYAFAHQAGFGELITSGLNMRDRVKEKHNSVVLTRVVKGQNDSKAQPTNGQTLQPKLVASADSRMPKGHNDRTAPPTNGQTHQPKPVASGDTRIQKGQGDRTLQPTTGETHQPRPITPTDPRTSPGGKVVFVERL